MHGRRKCKVVFEQVINNLLSDAIYIFQLRQPGSWGLESTQKEAILQVQDQGPGIAENEWKRLFMPFERLLTRNKPKRKSSGLGWQL
jgi:signal transduction histidine kinase